MSCSARQTRKSQHQICIYFCTFHSVMHYIKQITFPQMMDLSQRSILTSYLLFVSSCLRHYPEAPHMESTRSATWKQRTRTNLSQAVENDNKHRARQYTLNRDVATMEADRR